MSWSLLRQSNRPCRGREGHDDHLRNAVDSDTGGRSGVDRHRAGPCRPAACRPARDDQSVRGVRARRRAGHAAAGRDPPRRGDRPVRGHPRWHHGGRAGADRGARRGRQARARVCGRTHPSRCRWRHGDQRGRGCPLRRGRVRRCPGRGQHADRTPHAAAHGRAGRRGHPTRPSPHRGARRPHWARRALLTRLAPHLRLRPGRSGVPRRRRAHDQRQDVDLARPAPRTDPGGAQVPHRSQGRQRLRGVGRGDNRRACPGRGRLRGHPRHPGRCAGSRPPRPRTHGEAP